MRRIQKRTAPTAFTSFFKAHPNESWNAFQDKQLAREALCEEQGYLCCFCLGRIKPTDKTMKNAHFIPQNPTESKGSGHSVNTWLNLFGACMGGENERFKNQHCDTRQGNRTLAAKLNPLRYDRNTLQFFASGRVSSSDDQVNIDINEKLNLNTNTLVTRRRNALQAFRRKELSNWTKRDIENAIRNCQNRAQGQFQTDYEIVLQYLERKLHKSKSPTSKRAQSKKRH